MVLGAMLDAGLSLDGLREDVSRLGLGGVEVRASRVTRGGMACTRAEVLEGGCAADAAGPHGHGRPHGAPHPHALHGHGSSGREGAEAEGGHSHAGHVHGEGGVHRHRRGLTEILGLIEGSGLPERVRQDAGRVFRRLAEAEAAVHGCTPEEVHFHEVGAVDAIVDIVGAAAGLARLGVDEVRFSTLSCGGGHVHCEHGTLPVPAPATARLVEGFEVRLGGEDEGELLTPTGAAILTALGRQGPPPPMRVQAVGCGAGGREREGSPNLLRLWLGETADDEEADTVWCVETNLDDCPGEVVGYAMDRLFAEGALDVYLTPIQMKKSRPGVKMTVLADADRVEAMEAVLFAETPTFGVRRTEMRRSKLERESVRVDTPHGPVSVKVGRRKGQSVTVEPEYEDCRRVAEERGVSLREVMEAARRAARGG